jgi:hypothetical protein
LPFRQQFDIPAGLVEPAAEPDPVAPPAVDPPAPEPLAPEPLVLPEAPEPLAPLPDVPPAELDVPAAPVPDAPVFPDADVELLRTWLLLASQHWVWEPAPPIEPDPDCAFAIPRLPISSAAAVSSDVLINMTTILFFYPGLLPAGFNATPQLAFLRSRVKKRAESYNVRNRTMCRLGPYLMRFRVRLLIEHETV